MLKMIAKVSKCWIIVLYVIVCLVLKSVKHSFSYKSEQTCQNHVFKTFTCPCRPQAHNDLHIEKPVPVALAAHVYDAPSHVPAVIEELRDLL